MERRHFLTGVGGGMTILAGCTRGDDEPSAVGNGGSTDEPNTSSTDDEDGGPSDDGSDESTEDDFDRQPLPETEALVEQHRTALDDVPFRADERIEEASSATDDATVTEKTVRSDGTGTLLSGDDVARYHGSQYDDVVWFTDHTRIEGSLEGSAQPTYRQYPDGTSIPLIDVQFVDETRQILEIERTNVIDDDRVSVFEAVGVEERIEERGDIVIESYDVRIEIAESGCIRSFHADITFDDDPDTEETNSLSYEYEVTEMGEATVSKPAFVDETVQIEGRLSEDGSMVVLEHTGGDPISPENGIVVQDAEAKDPDGPNQDGATLPRSFEPGDEAYVYWDSDEDAAITIGEEPSAVGREFVRAPEENRANIFVHDRYRRFEIRFTDVA